MADLYEWASKLGSVLPVLASGFTRNPQTVQSTIQAHQYGQRNREKSKLRDFGRELFSIPPDQITEQQIAEMAQKHDVDLHDALELTSNFMKFRQDKPKWEMHGDLPKDSVYQTNQYGKTDVLYTAPVTKPATTYEEPQGVLPEGSVTQKDSLGKVSVLHTPKAGPTQKDSTPTQKLKQLDYDAWVAFYEGRATQEQRRKIKVDTDPYIAKAAQMVLDDRKLFNAPAEEKARKTVELANTMRQATDTMYKKRTDPQFDWRKWMPTGG